MLVFVGSVMYAIIGSRPELANEVGVFSRFMSKPRMDHWSAVKWILRYLRGESKASFSFVKISSCVIEGQLQDMFSRCGEIQYGC